MGRHSDSSDEHRHRVKKSKKSKKHKYRSRSQSRSQSRDLSPDNRHRSRHSKKSRHRHSRSRSNSRSSHHSRHHHHHSSHRWNEARSSPSRSRSTSRSHEAAVKELIDKVKERERQNKSATMTGASNVISDVKIKGNLLLQMSKSEKLEYRLQKALDAATLSDKAVKQMDEVNDKRGEAEESGLRAVDSILDDVKRHQTINAIDNDEYVASTFVSSKSCGISSGGGTLYRPADAHTAAMFGTAGTSRVLLDTAPPSAGLATGLQASIASTASATSKVRALTGRQLAGPDLCVPVAVKEKRWLEKLAALRQRYKGANPGIL